MQAEPNIVAIDAAWTPSKSSGVALVQHRAGRWHCLAIAPGFLGFDGQVAGTATDGSGRRRAGFP
ncbi:MAG: hypothetical protein KFF45_08515 [Thioalkalivibrio sp.]|nr:hypothetical protein [Thioalkalivibrio sp.]